MKIALNQNEVVAAIRGYVAAQGIDMAGKQLDVTFTSGRKGNGLTADLDIYTKSDDPIAIAEDVAVNTIIEDAAPESPVAVAPTEETGSLFG